MRDGSTCRAAQIAPGEAPERWPPASDKLALSVPAIGSVVDRRKIPAAQTHVAQFRIADLVEHLNLARQLAASRPYRADPAQSRTKVGKPLTGGAAGNCPMGRDSSQDFVLDGPDAVPMLRCGKLRYSVKSARQDASADAHEGADKRSYIRLNEVRLVG